MACPPHAPFRRPEASASRPYIALRPACLESRSSCLSEHTSPCRSSYRNRSKPLEEPRSRRHKSGTYCGRCGHSAAREKAAKLRRLRAWISRRRSHPPPLPIHPLLVSRRYSQARFSACFRYPPVIGSTQHLLARRATRKSSHLS